MIEAHLDCMPFALVPIISDNPDPLVCKSVYDFSCTIVAAVVYDDYFVVFRHIFEMLLHICDAFSDAVRFVVGGHYDGDSAFHESFDEFQVKPSRTRYCRRSENVSSPPV